MQCYSKKGVHDLPVCVEVPLFLKGWENGEKQKSDLDNHSAITMQSLAWNGGDFLPHPRGTASLYKDWFLLGINVDKLVHMAAPSSWDEW